MKNHREFLNIILFSFGKFISELGTVVYTFAVGLYVLERTGSGLSFATTLLFGMLPVILINPIAGVLADRFNKKKIIIIMDLLNGLLFIGLYVITSLTSLSLALIYAGIFLSNVFTTLFGISMETGKPYIVTDEKLFKLNAISKILDSIPAILGPVVGGLVFALMDIRSFMVINGISFLLSAGTELFIDFKFNYKNDLVPKLQENFINAIKGGVVYVRERKDIIELLGLFIGLNFFLSFSVSVPLPYMINNVLRLDPDAYGFIQGAFPIGMILGSLIVKKVVDKMNYSSLILKISMGIALCMLLMGIPLGISYRFLEVFYMIYYIFIMLLLGIGIALIDIPIIYYLQTTIPDVVRGRVLSLGMGIVKIITPVGYILSGLLITIYPVHYITLVAGGVFLIGVGLMLVRRVKWAFVV